MKIKKLQINNYRMLKNLNFDLENELSLVIGKNNCGKTSLSICTKKPDKVTGISTCSLIRHNISNECFALRASKQRLTYFSLNFN